MLPNDTDAAKTRELTNRLLKLNLEPRFAAQLCRALADPIAIVEVQCAGKTNYLPFAFLWQAVAHVEGQCNRFLVASDLKSAVDELIIGMGDGTNYYLISTCSLSKLPSEAVLEEALWKLRADVIMRAIEVVMRGIVTAEQLEGLRTFSSLQGSAGPSASG